MHTLTWASPRLQVRFFERVKIERKINKTQTALKAAGDEQNKAELQAQLCQQEEDLQVRFSHFRLRWTLAERMID